ncbi:MAG: 2-amino-4-hydroxy-6-hydroxymethyldihydropteridine diphosphokinase [Bacteroidetes bacterium]|nr:2-amino-4-hydroxy-6-hydroxymethyldihydropteridine diphosphokinase [Bacteroidota bacterium]
MSRAVILTGSNLGNLRAQLTQAAEEIERQVGKLNGCSAFYETAPWGNTEQPAFLNQVLIVETEFSARTVLERLLKIENLMGRKRNEKWAPRTIDLDILFYNDDLINEADLVIPHPFIQERRFTLIPLVELMPAYIHPKLRMSMSDLLQNCTDFSEVHRVDS